MAITPFDPSAGNRVGTVSLWIVVAAIVGVVLLIATTADYGALRGIGSWHDPVLTYFNLAMFMGAVFMPLFVAWRYFESCGDLKRLRLKAEMGAAFTAEREAELEERMEQIRFRDSAGSVLGVMFIVAIGGVALLFLKVKVGDGSGLNYGLGANSLLLGPLVFAEPSDPAVVERLKAGLTMFQFGFLGAFVFFLISLMRSYYTLDLTPHTFVEGTVRMTTASLVALVLSFVVAWLVGPDLARAGSRAAAATVAADPKFTAALAVLGFFLGMFPRRALVLLDRTASDWLRLDREAYRDTRLAVLPGMSAEHEVRLIREGFDNVENLAFAEPFDLAIRTGLPYGQLSAWIDQAKLRGRLGDDYDRFRAATGLGGLSELVEALQTGTLPLSTLGGANGSPLRIKLLLLAPQAALGPQA